jgi:hypothetical protein
MYNFHNLHIASPPPPDPSFSPAAHIQVLAKENKSFVCVAFYVKSKSTFAHQRVFVWVFFHLKNKCALAVLTEKNFCCVGDMMFAYLDLL